MGNDKPPTLELKASVQRFLEEFEADRWRSLKDIRAVLGSKGFRCVAGILLHRQFRSLIRNKATVQFLVNHHEGWWPNEEQSIHKRILQTDCYLPVTLPASMQLGYAVRNLVFGLVADNLLVTGKTGRVLLKMPQGSFGSESAVVELGCHLLFANSALPSGSIEAHFKQPEPGHPHVVNIRLNEEVAMHPQKVGVASIRQKPHFFLWGDSTPATIFEATTDETVAEFLGKRSQRLLRQMYASELPQKFAAKTLHMGARVLVCGSKSYMCVLTQFSQRTQRAPPLLFLEVVDLKTLKRVAGRELDCPGVSEEASRAQVDCEETHCFGETFIVVGKQRSEKRVWRGFVALYSTTGARATRSADWWSRARALDTDPSARPSLQILFVPRTHGPYFFCVDWQFQAYRILHLSKSATLEVCRPRRLHFLASHPTLAVAGCTVDRDLRSVQLLARRHSPVSFVPNNRYYSIKLCM